MFITVERILLFASDCEQDVSIYSIAEGKEVYHGKSDPWNKALMPYFDAEVLFWDIEDNRLCLNI